jgi:hypothetical protein
MLPTMAGFEENRARAGEHARNLQNILIIRAAADDATALLILSSAYQIHVF